MFLGKVLGGIRGFLGKGGPLAKVVGLKIGDDVTDREAERRNALARVILFSCVGLALIIMAVRCG